MAKEATSRNVADREDRFRLLVESVKDYAIFMLDPDGIVATWNAGAHHLKQYSAEEIIGQHFSKFYPLEDIAAGKPARELKEAIAEGRVEAGAIDATSQFSPHDAPRNVVGVTPATRRTTCAKWLRFL